MKMIDETVRVLGFSLTYPFMGLIMKCYWSVFFTSFTILVLNLYVKIKRSNRLMYYII